MVWSSRFLRRPVVLAGDLTAPVRRPARRRPRLRLAHPWRWPQRWHRQREVDGA